MRKRPRLHAVGMAGVMANAGCHHDWIWNQLRDIAVGESARTFDGRTNRGEGGGSEVKGALDSPLQLGGTYLLTASWAHNWEEGILCRAPGVPTLFI